METIEPRPVRMCVCFNCLFSQLKDAGVSSVEEAGERFGCGTNCGFCRPYIAQMIMTGEVAFEVITTSE
jgi:bacterioferritin-associated ferredoxin